MPPHIKRKWAPKAHSSSEEDEEELEMPSGQHENSFMDSHSICDYR